MKPFIFRVATQIALIGFISSGSVFCQSPAEKSVGSGQLMRPGTKPFLIDSSFGFTEGPAVDKSGNIYFTDQPNDKIWKYDTGERLTLFLTKTGRSNGMYFDANGNLISCADETGQLLSIDTGGTINVILQDVDAHRFNGPNDLWIDKSGGIYFTDPYYQRDYWTRKKPDTALGGEKVYYLFPDRKRLIVADGTTVEPNGIVGTPDGKFLYVADLGKKITFRYEIAGPGKLINKTFFAPEGSDGMTLDQEGNVYLTSFGVSVYNSAGNKIAHVDIPEPWTSNVCFGGPGRNILFITASKSIYAMPMLVHGVE